MNTTSTSPWWRQVLAAACDPGVETAKPRPRWLALPLREAQSLAQLLARLYVAQVFFMSGLTKLRDWSITLALFEDEYHVPLLPPELAAYMGTGGELLLPVLLVLGLGGRFAAAGLSVMNVVAVLSLAEVAPAALIGHQLWGSLLIGLLLWGPGRWSVDALLAARRR
ncbi:DoxX family protein [Paucibacter sp. APW11]|uniref:DoxX family protein n=1 Tax=Roseateles aquae TaxID=3077235 RepID=A0ABU3P837_9BURK|nr:DoxX family protein [Paucibacter sp. APW11]MDT8998735.1 DoxX family protein [Paucibacter sp. APW11]